jgi:hypothetical protein
MSDRQLLITRIDDTLTGDSWALRCFADWYETNSDRVTLAYCSWRLLDEVEEFLERNSLPDPDEVIGGSGTELHHYPTGEPIRGWGSNVDHWDAGRVREHLTSVESLSIDCDVPQIPLRVRCVAPNLSAIDLHGIRRRLKDVDLRVRLVYDDHETLDVLPEGIGKASAAAFLARQWQFNDDEVLVSAASVTDIDLFQRRFRGIVPANAHPALKRLPTPRIHQSRLACAAGVLDGIGHFDPDDLPPVAIGAAS